MAAGSETPWSISRTEETREIGQVAGRIRIAARMDLTWCSTSSQRRSSGPVIWKGIAGSKAKGPEHRCIGAFGFAVHAAGCLQATAHVVIDGNKLLLGIYC
jgi:hypothetical protein